MGINQDYGKLCSRRLHNSLVLNPGPHAPQMTNCFTVEKLITSTGLQVQV